MKVHFLLGILSLVPLVIIYGQDKDLENRFLREREKIKKLKVQELTERVSQYWKNQCIKDSAEIRFKYEFDRKGNLIRTDKFNHGHHWITTNYSRNKKGEFVQKSYTFYDSIDKATRVDSWVLTFNEKGQRVGETWAKGNDTVRVNKLTYDDRGNLIEQVANGSWIWRYQHDNQGNVVTMEECVLSSDSLRCHTTNYRYEDNLLIHQETTYNRPSVKPRQFDYLYDSNKRLMAVLEERTALVQHGDEPKTAVTYKYTTRYEYDSKGNCITQSEFRENEQKPFRCTYYDYKYR